MGWRATQVWGLKTSLVHSPAFPDSPGQAGPPQPSYCKRGMEFPGLSPARPTRSPAVQHYVGRSIFHRPRVDVLGNRIPGAQGLGRTRPPFGKGRKVEAIHTWCRSEGSSPASLASPRPLLRSAEAWAPAHCSSLPQQSILGQAANPLSPCHLTISFLLCGTCAPLLGLCCPGLRASFLSHPNCFCAEG